MVVVHSLNLGLIKEGFGIMSQPNHWLIKEGFSRAGQPVNTSGGNQLNLWLIKKVLAERASQSTCQEVTN